MSNYANEGSATEAPAPQANSQPVDLSLAIEQNIELDGKDFANFKKIGAGNFGEVFTCEWHGTLVAAKRLHQADFDAFKSELGMLKSLNHPHVVRFLGVTNTSEGFYLITEFLKFGDLKGYLSKNPQTPLSKILEMIEHIASGMMYLHSYNVIHRDVRLCNILLGDGGKAMVGDLGLARKLDKEGKLAIGTNALYPFRWAAPEIFSKQECSRATDVYSFGMVLWEIFQMDEPFEADNFDQTKKKVVEGSRPAKPSRCPESIWILINDCWNPNPALRPSFREINRIIKILRPMANALEEMEAEKRALPYIRPMELDGITEADNLLFCWRNLDGWIALTLEEGPTSEKSKKVGHITPLDLVGINGYEDEIAKCSFGWHWIKGDDETDYRFVTIEDTEKPSRPYTPKIVPTNFMGVSGYADEIANKKFCWRTVTREEESYNILTLE